MTKYKAIKSFHHDKLGHVEAGSEIELTPIQADTPLYRGDIEPVNASYETKIVEPKAVKQPKKVKESENDNSGATKASPKAE